jgi:membrane-associated phospholipid phosphatase
LQPKGIIFEKTNSKVWAIIFLKNKNENLSAIFAAHFVVKSKKNTMLRAILLYLILFPNFQLDAQLHIHKKSDLIIGITSTVVLGGSILAERKIVPLTQAQINQIQMTALPKWDLGANSKYRPTAKKTSDILLFGSIGVAPLFALLATKNNKAQRNAALLMWYNGAMTTAALTSWTKLAVRRTRPLVYNAQNPSNLWLEPDARLSFFSGHTSATAYNGFYAAQIYSTYFPQSKWKPLAWILGAGIPALTGIMRVRTGKHFPSDVLMGYAIGAGVAVVNHRLHKKI